MLDRVKIGLVALLFAAAIPSLHASPLKDSRRMISAQAADLSPLFHWWTNHHGARPLTAWVHVTGSVVGTNSLGWVVQAQVETTDRPRQTEPGPGKIVLRNPPLQEVAEFEQLSAQLKILNQQHAQVAAAEARAKKERQSNARVEADYRRHGLRNRTLAREDRVDSQVENEAKSELKPLDLQIQNLKAKLATYPNPDHYSLDCFALDTGQFSNGLPLFDHGVGLQ